MSQLLQDAAFRNELQQLDNNDLMQVMQNLPQAIENRRQAGQPVEGYIAELH